MSKGLSISIHAPSRERQAACTQTGRTRGHFNPRSLAGTTAKKQAYQQVQKYFNPRSLAGATFKAKIDYNAAVFQSTLPRGSDGSLPISL